jgi:hypothetical protein
MAVAAAPDIRDKARADQVRRLAIYRSDNNIDASNVSLLKITRSGPKTGAGTSWIDYLVSGGSK